MVQTMVNIPAQELVSIKAASSHSLNPVALVSPAQCKLANATLSEGEVTLMD